MKIVDIWINCPDEAVAEKISERLVGDRLVASSNLYPAIRSTYWWQNQIEHEKEVPLRVRTRADFFERVVEQVRTLHPYETPAILGVEVAYVNDEYRDWIIAETERSSASRTR